VIGLADAVNIPLFLVRYAVDFSWYFAASGIARQESMCRKHSSRFNWLCRDRKMPDELLETEV
jgi:hypothetical protein